MDIGLAIGAVATLIAIIAGVVQVVQYLQDRKEKKSFKGSPSRRSTDRSSATTAGVRHNLPHPDYKKFIGRDKEIEEIISALYGYQASQAYIVTIEGMGGVGKSSLAIEIAHRIYGRHEQQSEKERFEAVIWISARSNVFSSGRIISQPPTSKPLDNIYLPIAVTLGHPEITKLNIEEQHETVRHLLTQQRTLLIIDNLEVMDDEEILIFLHHLPEPTKVVVTTRYQVDLGYSVRLSGMDVKDAMALIQSESERRSILLTDTEMAQLYKKTWGIPLAIVLSIAQIAEGYGIENILSHLGKQTDDIARYCYENALSHLRGDNRDRPTPAWKLLMALSLFPAGTGQTILSEIAGLTSQDTTINLKKLEKLSLINQTTPGIFWMLPLLVEYSQDDLISSPEPVVARIRHNFAKAYMSIKIQSANAAKDHIHAVHLAIDLSDLIAWDNRILDFLVANRNAIKRGVEIVRIFVLDKRLTYLNDFNEDFYPEISRILDEQLGIGIDVYILWEDVIHKNNLDYPLDIIIFDTEEIHLHKGHGGWYPEATINNDKDEIEKWEAKYTNWMKHSIKWSSLRGKERAGD